MSFTNKAFDFFNVATILRNEEIIDSFSWFDKKDDVPIVIYTPTQSIRSNIFNYHAFVKYLSITSFVEYPNTVPCACSKFYPKYIDKNHQQFIQC